MTHVFSKVSHEWLNSGGVLPGEKKNMFFIYQACNVFQYIYAFHYHCIRLYFFFFYGKSTGIK